LSHDKNDLQICFKKSVSISIMNTRTKSLASSYSIQFRIFLYLQRSKNVLFNLNIKILNSYAQRVFPVLLNNHGNMHPAQHIKRLLKLSWTSILFIIYFLFSPFIPPTQFIIFKRHYAQIWRHSDMKWLNNQVFDSSGHNVKCRNSTFIKKTENVCDR
jgi:hypothetical protein